jgi:hypothetical protein
MIPFYTKKELDRTFNQLRENFEEQIGILVKEIDSLRAALNTQREELTASIESSVEQRIETIEQERQRRAESTTPYFELISEIDIEDEGKTKLELDWNAAFIDQLRSKGYVGKTEQDLIQLWIQKLAEHVEQQSKV